LDEAIENTKDAIKGWLLVEEKHGRPPVQEIGDIFLGEVTL
jgi:predicted RNase H-like HicB family nuclease